MVWADHQPSVHSQMLLQGHLDAPDLSHWLPMSFKTVDAVHRFVETAFRTMPVSRYLYDWRLRTQ